MSVLFLFLDRVLRKVLECFKRSNILKSFLNLLRLRFRKNFLGS